MIEIRLTMELVEGKDYPFTISNFTQTAKTLSAGKMRVRSLDLGKYLIQKTCDFDTGDTVLLLSDDLMAGVA